MSHTHTHTPHVGIGESCENGTHTHTPSLTSRQQWISGIISRAAATQNRCKRSSQSKVYLASCTPLRLADASNSKRNVVVEDTSATDEYHILVYSTCSTQRDVSQQLRSLAAAAFKTQEASSAVKGVVFIHNIMSLASLAPHPHKHTHSSMLKCAEKEASALRTRLQPAATGTGRPHYGAWSMEGLHLQDWRSSSAEQEGWEISIRYARDPYTHSLTADSSGSQASSAGQQRRRTGTSAAARAKCTCSCDIRIRASVSTTSLVMMVSYDKRN